MEASKGKYKKKVTDINTVFYINPEGEKITVFSPFELMVKEIASLGINPVGATISELKKQVSEISLEDYMSQNFGDNPNYIPKENRMKFTIIICHLNALSYWLYDYDANKMPANMKFDFELNRKRNTK